MNELVSFQMIIFELESYECLIFYKQSAYRRRERKCKTNCECMYNW